MITALQTTVPGIGADALPAAAVGPSRRSRPVLAAVLNELRGPPPNDVVLVLDDYHAARRPTSVHEAWRSWSTTSTARSCGDHAAARTRRCRWRGCGPATSWSRSAPPTCASPPTRWRPTSTRSTGWTSRPTTSTHWRHAPKAGSRELQLAACRCGDARTSRAFIGAVHRQPPVHRRLPRRRGAAALNPTSVREFLLHTAVLDRLTGPLCDAVTGRDGRQRAARHPGARQPVRRAPGRSTGVVPLPPPVRRRAPCPPARRASPTLVPVLHQRASDWCEHHDLIEDAVRHALAAGDFDRAAHLMELALPDLDATGRTSMLFGWLRELPDASSGAARAERLPRMDADGLRRPRRRSRYRLDDAERASGRRTRS